MKNIISLLFILSIFGSCSKEVQNKIPDPPEDAYEVVIYDQDDNIVFRGKGASFYTVVDNRTQISMNDPEPIQASVANPGAIASIFFQLNRKLSAPATLNTSSFSGHVAQGVFASDWDYSTKAGSLEITEVVQDRIRGEFTVTLTYVTNPNPNWGNKIKIKGKFYARCGYGC